MTHVPPESPPDTTTARLSLLAGVDSRGQPVMEQLDADVLENNVYRARQSPLFVRNLARDDLFTLKPGGKGEHLVREHSGYLALRVFCRDSISAVEDWLTPQVEMLDGTLDLRSRNALSYSIHVNVGFHAVESLFDNAASRFRDSVWYYGNVYDPADGTTPLNWWDAFLNENLT